MNLVLAKDSISEPKYGDFLKTFDNKYRVSSSEWKGEVVLQISHLVSASELTIAEAVDAALATVAAGFRVLRAQ